MTANRSDCLRKTLSRPVSGASLAIFRIGYGLVILLYISKFLKRAPDGNSILDFVFSRWAWHFSYPGFEWVRPLPPTALEIHYVLMGVAAVMVMLGIFYRYAISYVFVGFTYIFLLEATRYNNHYYLMSLMAFLLIWMPADARFSLRNFFRNRTRSKPHEPETVPVWNIWVLRFELFLVYFYGGIAKFNADWLRGEPIITAADKLLSFLQKWLPMPEAITAKEVSLFLAWGGLVFDLAVGFLLLHRRTRMMAFLAALLFHLHNNYIFSIGVFPLLASASTLIFFPPDWPLQLKDRVLRIFRRKEIPVREPQTASTWVPLKPVTLWFLAIFVVWQSVWPLRHFFIEGDANWTEEGHGFSWRMMLRSKVTGHLAFWIIDKGATGDDGATLDWEKIPAGVPKAVYISVESDRFDWDEHDGIVITREPVLGYRVFVHSASEESRISKESLAEEWEKLFGRRPEVHETISLRTALTEIGAVLREEDTNDGESIDQKLLANVREDFNNVGIEGIKGEKSRIAVINSLSSLSIGRHSKEIRSILNRLDPFALQGSVFEGESFYVIHDRGITTDNAEQELATLSQGNPYKIWLDMLRMRPGDWREFPRAYVASESEGLRIFWNHLPDMNARAASDFPTSPFYIRQYGRHVAKEWEKLTGRRPEVRVGNLVMLNYHQPKPLIDPTVDISRVPYHFHKHNAWITSRPERRLDMRGFQKE